MAFTHAVDCRPDAAAETEASGRRLLRAPRRQPLHPVLVLLPGQRDGRGQHPAEEADPRRLDGARQADLPPRRLGVLPGAGRAGRAALRARQLAPRLRLRRRRPGPDPRLRVAAGPRRGRPDRAPPRRPSTTGAPTPASSTSPEAATPAGPACRRPASAPPRSRRVRLVPAARDRCEGRDSVRGRAPVAQEGLPRPREPGDGLGTGGGALGAPAREVSDQEKHQHDDQQDSYDRPDRVVPHGGSPSLGV